MPTDRLLTVEEVARKLKISKPTLWRIIQRKEISVVRISKRTIRVKQEGLDSYIAVHYCKENE
jgi:excisionase family DNA binding protein